MKNPFVDNGIPNKDEFIGRKAEIGPDKYTNIAHKVFNDTKPLNLAIVGIRSIGKSSLVHNAILERASCLKAKKILIVSIDVSEYEESKAFFLSLVCQCVEEMEKHTVLKTEILDAFKKVKEEQTVDDIKKFFREVYETNYHLLFILDKFDHASEIFDGTKAFNQLRNLVSGEHGFKISLVLVAHRLIKVIEDKAGSSSPFYKLFNPPIRLAMFNDDDLECFFSKFSKASITISGADRNRISYFCGAHPKLLQLFGCYIVNRHTPTGKFDIDEIAKDLTDDIILYYDELITFLEDIELLQPLYQILFGKSFNSKDKDQLEKYGLIKSTKDGAYTAYSQHFHEHLQKLNASSPKLSPIATSLHPSDSITTSSGATSSIIFIQHEKVPFEEDLHHEFKDISRSGNPVQSIVEKAEEYAVAFLNAKGGSIFWGIDDRGSVIGVGLSRAQRDRIRTEVFNKLSHITPSGVPLTCHITFHKVYKSDRKTIIDNLSVVKLAVPEAIEVCFTKLGQCFVKTYGMRRRLNQREATEFVQHRKNLLTESRNAIGHNEPN